MSIVDNRKAFHDYFIEDRYEAGIVLQGWEVKAIRDSRVQLKEAYVVVRGDELFLFGAHVSALPTASGFTHPEALRTRKLLLHRAELDKLVGKVERSGYTLVPLNLHFKGGRVKCEIGLAKGKKQHDKRATEKDRDGKREVAAAMKQHRR
jgi:SsrA-binding protein